MATSQSNPVQLSSAPMGYGSVGSDGDLKRLPSERRLSTSACWIIGLGVAIIVGGGWYYLLLGVNTRAAQPAAALELGSTDDTSRAASWKRLLGVLEYQTADPHQAARHIAKDIRNNMVEYIRASDENMAGKIEKLYRGSAGVTAQFVYGNLYDYHMGVIPAADSRVGQTKLGELNIGEQKPQKQYEVPGIKSDNIQANNARDIILEAVHTDVYKRVLVESDTADYVSVHRQALNPTIRPADNGPHTTIFMATKLAIAGGFVSSIVNFENLANGLASLNLLHECGTKSSPLSVEFSKAKQIVTELGKFAQENMAHPVYDNRGDYHAWVRSSYASFLKKKRYFLYDVPFERDMATFGMELQKAGAAYFEKHPHQKSPDELRQIAEAGVVEVNKKLAERRALRDRNLKENKEAEQAHRPPPHAKGSWMAKPGPDVYFDDNDFTMAAYIAGFRTDPYAFEKTRADAQDRKFRHAALNELLNTLGMPEGPCRKTIRYNMGLNIQSIEDNEGNKIVPQNLLESWFTPAKFAFLFASSEKVDGYVGFCALPSVPVEQAAKKLLGHFSNFPDYNRLSTHSTIGHITYTVKPANVNGPAHMWPGRNDDTALQFARVYHPFTQAVFAGKDLQNRSLLEGIQINDARGDLKFLKSKEAGLSRFMPVLVPRMFKGHVTSERVKDMATVMEG